MSFLHAHSFWTTDLVNFTYFYYSSPWDVVPPCTFLLNHGFSKFLVLLLPTSLGRCSVHAHSFWTTDLVNFWYFYYPPPWDVFIAGLTFRILDKTYYHGIPSCHFFNQDIQQRCSRPYKWWSSLCFVPWINRFSFCVDTLFRNVVLNGNCSVCRT